MSSDSPPDLLHQIADSPLNPRLWETLREERFGEGSGLARTSIDVIIGGLLLLRVKSESGALIEPSEEQRLAFIQISTNLESPELLEDLSAFYRHHGMDVVADEHLNQAGRMRKVNRGPVVPKRPGMASAMMNSPTSMISSKGNTPRKRTSKVQLSEEGTPPGGGNVPEDNDVALNLAMDQAEAGFPSSAVKTGEVMTRRMEQACDQANVWHTIGQTLYATGFYAEAIQAYQRARAADDSKMSLWFNLGQALHARGDVDRALECYLHADELTPDHPKVWCNLSALYFQMDNYESAESAARQSLAFRPEYPRAWDHLASTLGAQERLDEAADACRKAIELRPDYFEPHFKLGVILYHKELYRDAERALVRALEMRPESAHTMHYLAMVCAKEGRQPEAIRLCREAGELDPLCEAAAQSWTVVGRAEAEQNRFTEAIQAYDNAITMDPTYYDSWIHRAEACYAMGDVAFALACTKRALECRRDAVDAIGLSADYASELGDFNVAVQALQRQVSLRPRDSQAWQALAKALRNAGREREAAGVLARAKELVEWQLNSTGSLPAPKH